ncbi:MAG TPA: ATP-binding protein [Coleofasciculaceae cyanobacterium]
MEQSVVGQGTASSLLRNIQILVVEDESVIAADIKDCLENIGYSVPAIAVSGEGAIAKAGEIRPNLVLMDIRLRGDMDGIEAADRIWRQFQIPVVYSSGYSDRNTLERAKATGPFGYVLKPVEERELYVAIETALQRFQLSLELQQREQWLTTILRGIGDGVIVVDTQSRIKFLNVVAEMLTGWPQEKAFGKALSEVFHIVNEQTRLPVDSPVTEVLRLGTPIRLADRTVLIAKNGREIPIDDSAAPFRDDHGAMTGVVIVFRDITDRRLAEERNLAMERSRQLESQMAELQRLNRLKDDFLSTVSHELRTPLANIKMAIYMLEIVLNQQGVLNAEMTPESNQTARYFKILSEQCDRELSLVNDLLDLQRLNAEAYLLTPSQIQLQNWLPHILEGFQERTQNRQQNLHYDIAADLPLLISDLHSLTRIFTELLNNACKYTPPGEQITVTAQLLNTEAAPSLTTDVIQIKVCNSGVEIPADQQALIFDQFYRIPHADRWEQGGTGLGLTLVKKLVVNLSGSIEVESGSGQTCFVIQLPRAISTF